MRCRWKTSSPLVKKIIWVLGGTALILFSCQQNQQAPWVASRCLNDSFVEQSPGVSQIPSRPCPEQVEGIRCQFQNDLKKGKFFTLPQGYYILLNDYSGWVFHHKSREQGFQTMFHLISEGGSFDNYSFHQKEQGWEQFLNIKFENYQLVRIQFDRSIYSYQRLRFGEFNESGNLWATEFDLNHIVDLVFTTSSQLNQREKLLS